MHLKFDTLVTCFRTCGKIINISMTFVLLCRTVLAKDTSCYLRNEQLNPHLLLISVIYFKGEML